jgi:hypothetical protein
MKKIAAACAALLTLSACGGGEEDEAKENIKASLLEQEGDDMIGTKPTEEQADCISEGMVDEVGVESLQEYGLLTEDLEINEDADPTDMSKDDAEALAAVFVDCVDMEALFAEQLAGASDQMTDEQRECIEDAIDEDAIEAGLAASFQGKPEEMMGSMQEDLMACVMGGPQGEGGTGDGEMQLD